MKEKITKKTRKNILAIMGIVVLSNLGVAVAMRLGHMEVDWIVYMSILTTLPLFGAGVALKDIPTLEE